MEYSRYQDIIGYHNIKEINQIGGKQNKLRNILIVILVVSKIK